MNRSDLIKKVRESTGLSQQEADLAVRWFFDAIAEGLAQDGRLELRGFGVFRVNTRNQAGFLNPKDGKYYGAVPVRTVKFKPTITVEKTEEGEAPPKATS